MSLESNPISEYAISVDDKIRRPALPRWRAKATISMLANETYESILSFLPTTASLKNASLINRRFNDATRRFLFSRIICANLAGPHRSSSDWYAFLQDNPSVAYHIRRIDLRDVQYKDVWHRLVTVCNTGASLHQLSLYGLALPFPWDSWDILITKRRTVSFSLCGLPVPAFVDVLLQERALDMVCIAENCVLTGGLDFSCTTAPACKLRVFHALAYGNGLTVFSFPSLFSAIVVACEFVVELHVRVAPKQSHLVTQLLVASTCLERLVIAFGPSQQHHWHHIEGFRFGEVTFPRYLAVGDVSVALPRMNAVQYVRLEGSSAQANNMAVSLKNWNLYGRVKRLRVEIHIFDLPLALRDWKALSTTFLRLCGARKHELCLFIDDQPRWEGHVGYWLDWVSQGQEPVNKGDMLLTLDLFI